MSIEVKIRPPTEGLRPQQGPHHAHHFGAFLVDRKGVEVGNLKVAVGAHRVGHGACVFGELGRPKEARVLNPLHRGGILIGGKLGIAQHREAFL